MPKFSVVVTTFDRVDLLRETLNSILNQRVGDFEVLVGNDNLERVVENDFPEIVDSRIQWFNNRKNLGAIENTNNLIGLAKGEYITTLADDDLWSPEFLYEMQQLIDVEPHAEVYFSNYAEGVVPSSNFWKTGSSPVICSGADWVSGYLSKRFRAVGCYGVFDRQFLTSIGNVHALGCNPKFSPYNDNLMAVQAGLAKKVVYAPDPLVFLRLHAGSMSYSSGDAMAYATAQQDFFSIVAPIPNMATTGSNADRDNLLAWFFDDFFSVLLKGPGTSVVNIAAQTNFLLKKMSWACRLKHLSPLLRFLITYFSPGLVMKLRAIKRWGISVFKPQS
jgi:glycosyltransferase involved in cell wall biosynthesis